MPPPGPKFGYRLHGIHVACELAQQSGLISRPRPDLEHPFVSCEIGQSQVQSVRPGSRDCLPIAQRQSDVVVRSVTNRVRNEHMPGYGIEGVQYSQVLNPSRLETLDQASPIPTVRGVYPPSIQERTSLIRR